VTGVRSFAAQPWTVADLARARGDRTISVCIPCRDEAETVGELVERLLPLVHASAVDEIVVLDDRSTDDSAEVARRAGARVVPIGDVHRRFGDGRGKGNALWSSMAASRGDFVVWCDGDVTTAEPWWVVRLMMPLLAHDDLALVKASYHRPTNLGGGGRTTELVARPLLSLFVPELTALHQPLAGEFAGRRAMLEEIPFVQGWGAEIAMLVDLARRFGPRSIGQVDLGVRVHRHQPLHALSLQATEVMATVLARTPAAAGFAEDVLALHRPHGVDEPLNLAERPPLARERERTARRGDDAFDDPSDVPPADPVEPDYEPGWRR
jgi:glucosyl-3-phosphoglycerate synthase